MFTSALTTRRLWEPFLARKVFEESLAWIAARSASAEEGIYELGEPGWFVNVHGYTTRPESQCPWENHRHTIDVQYLITGGEGIRVAAVETLGAPALYREESDTEKFAGSPPTSHRLELRPGDFAIFFPGEAHCPKVALGEGAPLRKLVVKIPARLLG